MNPRNDPRETQRESYAASIDWRPIPSLTLGFGYRRGSYDLFTAPDRMTLGTGNAPTAYGADFTQGRSGAATGVHQQIWTGKQGATDQFSLSSKFRQGAWKADFSASVAKSDLDYPNIQRGFFRSAVTRLAVPGTLRIEGFNLTDTPRVVELRNASTGAVMDWKNLSSYALVNVGADNRNATDEIEQGRLNVRRDLWLGRTPLAVQLGGAYKQRTLDRIQWTPNWTFLGADGRAGTADDSAGQFADPVNVGQNAKFNAPRDIQWVDLRKLWALYVSNPGYFSLVEPAAYITSATSSERLVETVTAGYLQSEVKFLENRLAFLGGVRFERTENLGTGLLRDRNAIYRRDAAGNLIRDAAGRPILITTDALAQAKLSYQPRGLTVSKSYDGFYPSANLTFNVTPDFLLRGSFSRTMGRPEFSNIIPNVDVNEDTETVTARNPSLKPWTGKNYEVSAEYYFKSGGVVSASVFRKDLTNAFITATRILDQALLAEYGLDSLYAGWDLVGRTNAPDVTRIYGLELSWQQQLKFLPVWARGLSVFANATFLDTAGSPRIGLSLQDKTINWGVSLTRKRPQREKTGAVSRSEQRVTLHPPLLDVFQRAQPDERDDRDLPLHAAGAVLQPRLLVFQRRREDVRWPQGHVLTASHETLRQVAFAGLSPVDSGYRPWTRRPRTGARRHCSGDRAARGATALCRRHRDRQPDRAGAHDSSGADQPGARDRFGSAVGGRSRLHLRLAPARRRQRPVWIVVHVAHAAARRHPGVGDAARRGHGPRGVGDFE